MNPDTRESAKSIFASVMRRAKNAKKTVVIIAPPAPFIHDFSNKDPIHVSAQDVSQIASGAFTGSVSARQLKSAGAEYAIIGHSERRLAGDTNQIVIEKVKRAIEAGLRIILCVGESERDDYAKYFQTVRDQVLSVITAVDKKSAQWMTIAYEPVWAIGKSYDLAPDPSDIHEMSIYIKKIASESLGKKAGLRLPVLYGGSVDAENAKNILKNAEVDGLLIGRESLNPKYFGEIIDYANSI